MIPQTSAMPDFVLTQVALPGQLFGELDGYPVIGKRVIIVSCGERLVGVVSAVSVGDGGRYLLAEVHLADVTVE